jgi:hypothetical protein
MECGQFFVASAYHLWPVAPGLVNTAAAKETHAPFAATCISFLDFYVMIQEQSGKQKGEIRNGETEGLHR